MHAVAVVLDFVQRAAPRRRLVYQARELRLDPFRRPRGRSHASSLVQSAVAAERSVESLRIARIFQMAALELDLGSEMRERIGTRIYEPTRVTLPKGPPSQSHRPPPKPGPPIPSRRPSLCGPIMRVGNTPTRLCNVSGRTLIAVVAVLRQIGRASCRE